MKEFFKRQFSKTMDDSYAIASPHNELFNQTFLELNPHGAPRIGAAEAANFLKKSNLSMPVLGQIWELSDSQKTGSLDKRGAFVAFKLVAAAQQGKPIANSSLYDSSLQPPRFGPPVPPASMQHHFQPAFPSPGRAPPPPIPPHPSQASLQSSPNHQPSPFPPNWPINATDQAKYDSIFASLNPVNGKLSGATVRPVLMNSGLDAHTLARLWELSDQDKDGNLDRFEMSVALHLVYRCLQSEPLPSQLPANLTHPSKASLPARGPTGPPPPHPPRPFMGSRAGSVTSLRASGASTPISTSHSVHSFGGVEFPINTADYALVFSQTDTNNDGLVDGHDMRAPMMATGLSAQILAHVWALADLKKCGQLNLEQFSLVMYLVEMAKRGESIPNELPAQLIPPSFRPEPLTPQPPQNQSVSTPQLPEATSMEIKEALEGENEEMRQLAEAIQSMVIERKTAEDAVVQLEADMTVKNSKIKNLQVELATLESTVKQLERQKTEANRRLADYDTQIEQLEAACKTQSEKKEETEKRLKQIDEDAKNAEEFKQNDEKELAELKNEIEVLDVQFRNVRSEMQKEIGAREAIVGELTSLERKEARDHQQLEKIETAVQNAEKLTEELAEAVGKPENEMVEILKGQPRLLNSSIDSSLLSDETVYGETSGASTQNHVHQPPDPFASARANPSADPFAQVDQFAGHFDAAFPTDPFGQGFPSDAAFSSSTTSAKPAPPRPAPPKSNRETPVNDPFAPSQGQESQSAGFANFADFGSAFN